MQVCLRKESTGSVDDMPAFKRFTIHHDVYRGLMHWQMIQDVELDENKFSFDENDDIFCISNVLKQCESARCADRCS